MKKVRLFLLTILIFVVFGHNTAFADGGATETCPVNMKISFQEDGAFRMFNAHLSHLRRHFGQTSYEAKLVEILEKAWPEEKVIDISPAFMERTLNLVEQQHIKHYIAQTIGFENENWQKFERVMKTVTIFDRTVSNKHQQFTKLSEALIRDIEKIQVRQMKKKGLMDGEGELLRARTITGLANMFVYLQRWSIINNIILEQEVAAIKKKIITLGIGFVAVGIGSIGAMYMGSVLAVAGTIGAKFATDVIVAANLYKLGQVVAGAGLGAVGAPVITVTIDAFGSHIRAVRDSKNNKTAYACEIDRQIAEWKKRGVSPYVKVSLIGAGLGMGGVMSLHAIGAKALLAASTFSIGVAQAYTVGKLYHNTVLSLAEFRYAIEAQDRGDKQAAIKHLHRSRDFAAKGKESAVEALIIGILSVSTVANLKPALMKGEDAIRTIYANSADTLPEAFRMVTEVVDEIKNMVAAQ